MGKTNSASQRNKGKLLPGLQKRLGLDLFGSRENEALKQCIAKQEEQIRSLTNLLATERKQSTQLTLLSEIEQHLKIVLDQPVAAQLVVNAVQRAFDCQLAAVFTYDVEHKEFVALAVAGNTKGYPPPDYRQRADQGLLGRAARRRETVVANDTRIEPDFIRPKDQPFLSEVVVPLVLYRHIKGVLVVDHVNPGAFSTSDVLTLKIVAEQLVNAWERSGYHQRLTELIQAGVTLSTLLEPQAVVEQLAAIAKQTLEARFVFATLLDQEGSFTRTASAGSAPQLLRSLRKDPEINPLIQAALNSTSTLRMRDIRRSNLAIPLKIEQTTLKGLLAFPIRLHQLSIGVILAFGKTGQAFFSENDESLAHLVASQAAAAIESTWLYQELRTTLQTATLLYQLSTNIMQAEDMEHAAIAIAETAFRLGRASLTGIILFAPDGKMQVQVEVDANGTQPGTSHPASMIDQALKTGQTIIISDDRFASKICVPLQTLHRTYGALWLDIPEGHWYNSRYSANLQTLTNQATVALERSLLLVQTRNQAHQLEAAYKELETTYDQTLAALTSALDARDRETEGHSSRVGKIACRLGEKLGITPRQLKALERGALLHDIGKIGVSDAILLKPGPLTEEEWDVMHQHPEIGAHIVEEIPFLSDTIPILRYHHERWDGSGYPVGLAGTEIPVLARIFAVADAFDAMVSDRPYRKKTTEKEAFGFLQSQSGTLFDPEIVTIFIAMIAEGQFNDILRKK